MATTAMGPAVDGCVALAVLVATAAAAALISEGSAAAARRKLRLVLASSRRRISRLVRWMVGGMVPLLDLGREQRHSLLHLGELRSKLLLRLVGTGG
jgi:hypothetical protein